MKSPLKYSKHMKFKDSCLAPNPKIDEQNVGRKEGRKGRKEGRKGGRREGGRELKEGRKIKSARLGHFTSRADTSATSFWQHLSRSLSGLSNVQDSYWCLPAPVAKTIPHEGWEFNVLRLANENAGKFIIDLGI